MNENYLGLDYGAKKIGVARVNSFVRIVEPLETLKVDGSEIEQIKNLIEQHEIDKIVLGWPRNMSGEETKQTAEVEKFYQKLDQLELEIIKQDESLTSVEATSRLVERGKSFAKADIDALAAAIILEDYIRSIS